MPLDLSLPFQPRSPLPINSAFGVRPLYGDMHTGIDFNSYTNAPAGAWVRAAGSGVVIESYNGNVAGQTSWAKLRGTMVVIDHGRDAAGVRWVTRYHMLIKDSNIPRGTVVSRGTPIGRVGMSGLSATGAHLHFELWRDGKAVDPMIHLRYTGLPSGSNAPAGGGAVPFPNDPSSPSAPSTPTPPKDGDLMIRIQSPARGIALVGAGYYRQLSSTEEVQQSDPLVTGHFSGNDRQFDVWVSLAIGGTSANSGGDATIKVDTAALVAAVGRVEGQTKPKTVTRSAGSKATLLPADGGAITIPENQDDADTNSMVRELIARPAGGGGGTVDVDALAAAIVAKLPKFEGATKADVVAALEGLTLDINLTGKAE